MKIKGKKPGKTELATKMESWVVRLMFLDAKILGYSICIHDASMCIVASLDNVLLENRWLKYIEAVSDHKPTTWTWIDVS